MKRFFLSAALLLVVAVFTSCNNNVATSNAYKGTKWGMFVKGNDTPHAVFEFISNEYYIWYMGDCLEEVGKYIAVEDRVIITKSDGELQCLKLNGDTLSSQIHKYVKLD